MKGLPALALIEALIADVTPHLPPSVRAVRARMTPYGSLQVWAVPSDAAPDAGEDFLETHADPAGGSVTSRGPEAPFGIGTWIPLLPTRLAFRLAVTDALDLIKEAVRRVATTWPAPDAAAEAEVQDGGVLVWFEDAAGHQVLPATTVAFPR